MVALRKRPAAALPATKKRRKKAASIQRKRVRRETTPAYGLQSYWEARYAARSQGRETQETDEWLMGLTQVKALLPRLRDADILDLGCGVSGLLRDLRKSAGARGRLTGIDYSPAAIATCKRSRRAHGVEYLEMDARSMDFADNSFDVVVDKATLDGQLCGSGSAAENVRITCKEVSRVLKPRGTYVIITWRGPGRSGDLAFLEDVVLPGLKKGSAGHGWKVQIHSLETDNDEDDKQDDFGRLPNVFMIVKSATVSRTSPRPTSITQHFH